MLKKALFVDENRIHMEPRTGFLQFYVKTKKVCKCFASFSSEQAHFTHGMYITALIRPSHVTKIELIMFYKELCQSFQASRAFAVVVTSRSSSFKYTMLVHAVHAGSERNVCNIEVSTGTHQTTTNSSQKLIPVYKLAHLPLPHSKSSPQRPQ